MIFGSQERIEINSVQGYYEPYDNGGFSKRSMHATLVPQVYYMCPLLTAVQFFVFHVQIGLEIFNYLNIITLLNFCKYHCKKINYVRLQNGAVVWQRVKNIDIWFTDA